MKNKSKIILFICFTLTTVSTAFTQVTVSGPTCVVPGTVYEYTISGQWDSTSTMQVCITGGVFSGSAVSCTENGKPSPFVLVSWTDSKSGSLSLTSSLGNASINIIVSSTLKGGTIITASSSQQVTFNALANTISCSPATGGSCSPGYNYQWQESLDRVNWKDINGATSQNFSSNTSRKHSTYFRRRVTELSSGTIAYSDIATVNVGDPPPGTIISLIDLSPGTLSLVKN